MRGLSFRTSRAQWFAGACVTVLFTLGFLLLFFNRFVGLRSGEGGFSGALMLLSGILPYRDYYSSGPPLFLLRTSAILALFGHTMFAIRTAAVVERLLLAFIVYAWLARLFKAQHAALAAIVTMTVSTLDLSDPISSYNHMTILMAVAAAFVSSYSLDENRSVRALLGIGATAGVLAFLCIACKQTIGLAMTVALPITVGACLLRLEGVRKAAAYVSGFAAAYFASLLVLLAYFQHLHILHEFLQQILVTGPAAKASHPGDFLTRTIFVMRQLHWEATFAACLLLLSLAPMLRSANRKTEDGVDSPSAPWQMAAVFVVAASSLGLALYLPHHFLDDALLFSPMSNYFAVNQVLRSLIYYVLFGSGVLGWIYFMKLVMLKGPTRRQSQILLFLAASFSVAFMLSLSYPAFEAMTVPGLGILLAMLLERAIGWRRWIFYVSCALLLVLEIQNKLDVPFEFAAWYDPPVALASQRSTLPELKGLRLPAETIRFVDGTVRIIQENSAPTDTIFTYPEFAIFYGLSHRMPATFSGSHNLDVVPDAFARQEAARLLEHPPAVIIYGSESEGFLIWQEMLWRNGMPCGQRSILAAIDKLKTQYHLEAKFAPWGRGGYYYVYVRPKTWPVSTMGKVF